MQLSADTVWGVAQQQLRSLLNTDIYNLWFSPIKATALDEDTLTLEVANDFCEVWLKDNYLGLIHDTLAHASGQHLKVKFQVNPAGLSGTLAAPEPKTPKAAKAAAEQPDRNRPATRDASFNP